MQMVDWVIVPSIWWENSPVVIQEAFACRTPVIGTDHGGIAEKIIGQGGIGFQPNDVEHLSSRMSEVIGNSRLHENCKSKSRLHSRSTNALLDIYSFTRNY